VSATATAGASRRLPAPASTPALSVVRRNAIRREDTTEAEATCCAFYLLAFAARYAVQDGNVAVARTYAKGARRLAAAFGEHGAV
jgi:hypothetical protein